VKRETQQRIFRGILTVFIIAASAASLYTSFTTQSGFSTIIGVALLMVTGYYFGSDYTVEFPFATISSDDETD